MDELEVELEEVEVLVLELVLEVVELLVELDDELEVDELELVVVAKVPYFQPDVVPSVFT